MCVWLSNASSEVVGEEKYASCDAMVGVANWPTEGASKELIVLKNTLPLMYKRKWWNPTVVRGEPVKAAVGSRVCKVGEGVLNQLRMWVTLIRGEELAHQEHGEQRRIEPLGCE